MKSRRLKQCVGRQGAEGAKDDDWLCVDCYDTVAHFMMPSKSDSLVDQYREWAPYPFLVRNMLSIVIVIKHGLIE